MNNQETYRQCAAIMVLRLREEQVEFLLLHKPRVNDAWQLPQGGIEEGESLEVAALRELREEAGIEAMPIGTTQVVYQYDFPSSFRSYRPDTIKGQSVSFMAAASLNQEIQVDDHEIDSYAWIHVEDLPNYITREEYIAAVSQVYAEALPWYQQYLQVNT